LQVKLAITKIIIAKLEELFFPSRSFGPFVAKGKGENRLSGGWIKKRPAARRGATGLF
jgi:hypothetical protein